MHMYKDREGDSGTKRGEAGSTQSCCIKGKESDRKSDSERGRVIYVSIFLMILQKATFTELKEDGVTKKLG